MKGVVLDVSSATRQLLFNKQTPRTGLATGLMNAGMLPNRHNRPIGAHFHSGGAKFSYFGEDFDEAFG
jgi:hypothetical protein